MYVYILVNNFIIQNFLHMKFVFYVCNKTVMLNKKKSTLIESEDRI